MQDKWFVIPGKSLLLFNGRVTCQQVRKYKKDAIVILIIGAIMLAALVLMTMTGIAKLVAGAPLGFAPFC